MGLVGELLKLFEQEIQAVALVPSDGGKFEVSIDGKLVYSKLRTGRHAQAGEIAGLVNQYIQG